jgi:hypothetical protein
MITSLKQLVEYKAQFLAGEITWGEYMYLCNAEIEKAQQAAE